MATTRLTCGATWVRDKDTGKSRGFAFLAYEDQRSTVLAVDNLSGARVVGRTVRVDHVDNYKLKRAEVNTFASPTCSVPSGALDAVGFCRFGCREGTAVFVCVCVGGGACVCVCMRA